MKTKTNYLKFWGTRGSCPVSGPQYAQFGGNTCCLELCYENSLLLFDAGTGIRPLGIELQSKNVRKIDLFLSHTHWDHLIGFPFFEPLFQKGAQITIWSPAGAGRSCRELLKDLLAAEFFPVHLDEVLAQIDFRTIHPKTPIAFNSVTLDFHATHHPGLTLCFKIQTPHQTIGYITDNEMLHGYHGDLHEIPSGLLEPHQSLIEFYQNCDLLVHEAQYTPEEYLEKAAWGHSSLRNTAALIQCTRPKQWLVTHHDPKHTDDDLHHLCQVTRKILADNNIPCPVEWIPDSHVISLK